MPTCYVLPGLLSSRLWFDAAFSDLMWVDYGKIALGKMGAMRLAPNGVDPGPPDGRLMHVFDALPDYWTTPYVNLKQQLDQVGYSISLYAYDWRKRFLDVGRNFAALIRSQVTAADPCAIVAHSMGGLVARAAWSDLLSTGDDDLVRRIVTLGTPHQGSYGTVMAFSKAYEAIDQLSFLTNIVASQILPYWLLVGGQTWSLDQIRDWLATFPSFYDLFPVIGSPDSVNDSNRAALFDRNNWIGGGFLSQTHLDYARSVVGPWQLSPASVPPPWVLTTVSAYGVLTRDVLDDRFTLGTPGAIGTTFDGDGSVTVASAEITPGAVYSIPCHHSTIPQVVVLSGDLIQWILDPRKPWLPTPPRTVIPGPLDNGLAGPPIPQWEGQDFYISPCSKGVCSC